MKTTLRRMTAFVLALVLSTASISAAASYAMGDDLTQSNKELNYSSVLSTNVFWSSAMSDLRTENLITYSPNTAVTPIVTYGNVITSRSTVSSMAKQLEAKGYRVVAGINGDFYNTTTGVPIGLVVTEGVIRTGAAGHYAIGFRADGTSILGKPTLSFDANLGLNGSGEVVIRKITDMNKARVSTGGIYLYDAGFNSKSTTGSTEPGVDVVCTVSSGTLSMGGTVTLQVERVVEATAATAIGPNQYVLSCNAKSDPFDLNALRSLVPGQPIDITVSCAPGWEDVQYAVGALYSLVANGAVGSGFLAGAAPRTAIGQKPDGSLIIYTIDGRKSGHSIGATMAQVAERLIELGCTTALCLDGGGSTTLSVTQPDAYNAALVNKPSDNAERSVTNHVFLVATNQPTGMLSHLYVSPENSYVLAGSSVKIGASGVDTNYIPMTASDFSLSASAGTVTDKVLTTPVTGGDITVTATQDGKSGTAVVHAITTPDSIAISDATGKITNLTVAPGESVTLKGSAIYNHFTLASDAGAFTWTATGDIGTIDAKGVFTAAATPGGTGTITATSGSKTATVNVKVSTLPMLTLEGFETAFEERTGTGVSLSRNTAAEQVRMGRASGKVVYDVTGVEMGVLPMDYTFRPNYDRLTMWVYGDNSGNTLSVTSSAPNADGATVTTSSTPLTVLDFTGWKQVSAKLPAGSTTISSLDILPTGSASKGTLYLDQITAAYGDSIDNEGPAISASIKDGVLTATVKDAVDGVLPQTGISVTYDGKGQNFTYDAAKGTLTATVAVDGKGHRLSVTAMDGSGNMARKSVDIASTAAQPVFKDTKGHWTATYADYLYTAGITTGYADGSFRPGNNLSRQEFAVMLFRYLGLDGTKYESVELPFADNGKIADFAKTPIKALYTIGIINGTPGKDGKLYFNPNSSIIRAQAAAMIGRTQAKGYAAPALTFKDNASIQPYASFYISSLVSQGVLGGYEDGTFRPNTPITRGQMAKILYNLL